MPKAKPLHSKGKVNSIQKPCNMEKDDIDHMDPDETMRQFQLELLWCIQQLERTLSENKGTEKQLQEAWKVLTVLKNNNQPIVRKRQLMRTHLGDYRAKMQAEEKKIAKMASKIKISDSPAQPKATFLRKSAFLSTGNEAFKFNFNIPPEQPQETTETGVKNETSTTDVTNNEDAEKSDTGVTRSGLVGDSEVAKSQKTDFKFNFSNSEFKFNFNCNS